MSFRTRVSLVAVWVASLITVAVMASGQVPQRRWTGTTWIWGPEPLPSNLDPRGVLNVPTFVAGSDLGFRIESTKDNIPVGKIVLRIDGHWVDAQVGGSGIIAADTR